MYLKLFVCVFVCTFVGLDAEILCEVGFCRNYQFDPGCASTSSWCSISNATHSGQALPSPSVCNCCDYCLPHFTEGSHCSLGGAGDGSTIGRCGPGLYCMAEDDGNFCRRMSGNISACHAKQDDFDLRYEQGLVGALERRAECDGKGKFAAYDCVPTQTCFCQSEDGERLFGEAPYRGNSLSTAPNMHCGCSRLHDKINKSINSGLRLPAFGPRCTQDGNFNPVQCIDRMCYCVDTVTGLVRDTRSVDLEEEPLTELPCYDAQLDLFPEQSTTGPPYNYTTPCFESVKEKDLLLTLSEEEGYEIGYFSSVGSCLPDGTFGRIAETRNRTRICVDERGERIGNYEAAAGTPEYENMDCKCALTTLLLPSSLEPPTCCSDGSFRRVQCRRGACRCVDAAGRQVARERPAPEGLPCYTADWQTC